MFKDNNISCHLHTYFCFCRDVKWSSETVVLQRVQETKEQNQGCQGDLGEPKGSKRGR